MLPEHLPHRLQTLASLLLISLIGLCLAWELWLAPLHAGGSWLVIKAIVLLAPLFGILRGQRYTYKWLTLLLQFYLLEGLVRATSEQGNSQSMIRGLASLETLLAAALLIVLILYIRATRRSAG